MSSKDKKAPCEVCGVGEEVSCRDRLGDTIEGVHAGRRMKMAALSAAAGPLTPTQTAALRPARILVEPSLDHTQVILEMFEPSDMPSMRQPQLHQSRHCVWLCRSESGPWLVRDGAVLGFRWRCSCGVNGRAAHTPPDTLLTVIRGGLAHFDEVSRVISVVPVGSSFATFNQRFLRDPAPAEAELAALAKDMLR